MNSPEKTALVVLGMHRSGTSSITGVLVKLGASAPKTLMPASPSNERGYFESVALTQLNDDILASANSTWHDWRAFDDAWLGSPMAQAYEEKAAALVSSEYGSSSLIVIKDPRMCRIAPFWFKVLEGVGYSTRVIIPVRSPLEVATSLLTRYGFDVTTSLLLWLRHTLDAEAASRNLPRAVIYWPDFLADWRLNIARAGVRIGVSWPGLSDHTEGEIDQFLTPALRHFSVAERDFERDPDVTDWVRLTYEAMIALAANVSTSSMALQTLDYVKAEFERGSTLFGRALISLQAHATNASCDAAAARAERDALVGARDKLLEEAAQYRQRLDALALDRATLAEQLAKVHGMPAQYVPSPIANAPSYVAADVLGGEDLHHSLEIAESSVVPAIPAESAQREMYDRPIGAAKRGKGKVDVPDPLSALRLEAEALRRNIESLQDSLSGRGRQRKPAPRRARNNVAQQ